MRIAKTMCLLMLCIFYLQPEIRAQGTGITFQRKLTEATSSQPTAFTYQGKLTDGGVPANGMYDFQFTLYDAANTDLGSATGALPVTNGIFTASIDGAGPLFTSSNPAVFLEIGVKLSGGGSFTTLAPRQPITNAPYAIKSLTAASSESLSVTCVTCVADSQISSLSAGKISGVLSPSQGGTGIGPTSPPNGTFLRSNGAGWQAAGIQASDVPSNISVAAGGITGVLGTSQGGTGSATQNFVDLTANQTIAGNKTFSGSLSGNGNGLSNLNGGNLTDASVTAAKLAYGATVSYDPQLVATLRWDLMFAIKRVDFTTGNGAFALAFDGANMWISNYLDNTVTKLRAGDGVNLGTFAVGTSPRAMAYDGANMWVLNNGSGSVTKLRASDGANLGTFTVGSNPQGIVFDGANIWSVNQGSDNVTKLRASDGVSLGTFAVVTSPRALAFDGTNIWVGSFGDGSPTSNVRKLRASDGANIATYSSCRTPVEMAFDGSRIYITCSVGASTLGSFPIGGSVFSEGSAGVSPPSGVAFDGLNIWVAGSNQNAVAKGFVQIPVGVSPRSVAFDGRSIWVTNYGSNTVTRLTEFR